MGERGIADSLAEQEEGTHHLAGHAARSRREFEGMVCARFPEMCGKGCLFEVMWR